MAAIEDLGGGGGQVFVRKDQAVFDLNEQEEDVLILGAAAHLSTPWVLQHSDYRESLGSCMPRVQRWAQWVLQHPNAQPAAHELQDVASITTFSSQRSMIGEMAGP
ncbi:hypothetical protein PLA107_032910 (plasmid) [Pseudomonas amygdali pv. lachrymans str. M301315]|uniref:Uncharacterized protein n=1 Tax=Pseudomonas amygdali pv. lachrymans str. M301315 TaxID=629260 RepID=A0AAD0PWG3_PSEAV|nr:hypothetical protein PLA107_032910 [Pseudomonas amygdali pv. lachrymans str. M301315]